MSEGTTQNIRLDYQVILDLVQPNSRVIDLGCGDGELLSLLIKHKNCQGTGIEIDEKGVYQSIAKGLTISHEDINYALESYPDKRFDYVILNESLQEVLKPQRTILEALRVGKKVIVGVPNFCHIIGRLQIFFLGRVPVTKELPYQWYDTPNLRFFSLKDFKSFCHENRIKILTLKALGVKKTMSFLPNLFAHIGIFELTK
jgi:methionine biosynthesis protein MetW